MITYKQLTLAEIFEDCQNNFDNDNYPSKKQALYRGNRLSGKRGRYSMLSSRSITSDEAGRK